MLPLVLGNDPDGAPHMYRQTTTIDFAKAADIREISEISRKYIEHGLGWKYTPARLKALLASDIKNVVVARTGGRLTGFGVMTYHEEQANLDLIAVRRPWQRRGTGSQILRWLEQVALAAGITIIFVQVRKANTGAIAFYANQGYSLIEEVRGYYRGRETAVIMSRQIRQMILYAPGPSRRDRQKSS